MRNTSAVLLAMLCLAGAARGWSAMTDADLKARLDQGGIKYKSVVVDTNGTCLVDLAECGVSNITKLKSLPITWLNLKDNPVKSLAPLKDMKLTVLAAANTGVADLTPLKGMKLEYLDIQNTAVTNLAPLAGMPIIALFIANTGITDLTPLTNMPIRELVFTPSKITKGLDTIQKMRSIKMIGIRSGSPMPAAVFWKKLKAKELR